MQAESAIAMAASDQEPLHILFFPLIAPGHLIPVADMATLFASRGVKCTILTTPKNAAVICSTVDQANAARGGAVGIGAPAIDMFTVPFPNVGLPPGVESIADVTSEDENAVGKLTDALQRLCEPFDRFLAEHHPDAVVVDSFLVWAADTAAKHRVPRLAFNGSSMFAGACNDSLLRSNPFELAVAPDDPDAAVVSLPGLPRRVALRRSQVMDPTKNPRDWEYHQLVNAADQSSYGEVFNSFAELEPDFVEHYRRTLGRRVWLVGPLSKVTAAPASRLTPDAETCLRWLDDKPSGSVVYVSFGTLTHFTAAELREVARGLQQSGRNFLWVVSGADAEASQWIPEGFTELIAHGERGLVFREWAPQRLILNHSAIGGFLTHCGWNSVLEAISAGVPLVTWPRYSDQFYNEKLVLEELKVGVGVGAAFYASKLEVRHEVISGEKIAEAIERVMGDGEEAVALRKKAAELSGKAMSAIEEGGSSYDDVGQLINELIARRRRSSVNV